MKHEAGYTLLELLVVLAIIGILIASLPGIALPGVAAAQFSGKVQTVATRLSTAHTQAIATGRIVTIKPTLLATGRNGLSVTASSPSIVFFPDGSAKGGNVVITTGTFHRTLRIDALTGRISVLDGT